VRDVTKKKARRKPVAKRKPTRPAKKPGPAPGTSGLAAKDNAPFFRAIDEALRIEPKTRTATAAIRSLTGQSQWSAYGNYNERTLRRHYRRWATGKPAPSKTAEKEPEAARPSAPGMMRAMHPTSTPRRLLAETSVLPLPPGFLSRSQAIENILCRLNCSVGMAEATLRKALDSGEVRMQVPNVWPGRLVSVRRKNAREFEVIIRLKGDLIPGAYETTEIVEERDMKISDEDLTDWLNRLVVSNNR
jgi:hypothetical protein